jgi:hypothetical protein
MLFLITSQSIYCFFTFYESENTTKQQRSILIYLGLKKFTVNPSHTKQSQGPTCKSLNHKEETRSKDSSPVLFWKTNSFKRFNIIDFVHRQITRVGYKVVATLL